MSTLREDIRCNNCGSYAPDALEKVAELLDELSKYEHSFDALPGLLITNIIQAWKEV